VHDVIGQLFAPWRRASTFWALGYTVLDVPAAIVTIPVMVLLVLSVALLVVFPLALPVIWVLFALAHQFCRLERSRVAALLGVRLVDPVPPLTATNWFARLWERVRSGARWREIAYIVLLRPMALLSALTALVLWCGSLAMIALPLYVDDLPGGSAKFWLFEITSGVGAWGAAAAGVIGIALLAPWATVGIARLDLFIARHLISTGERGEFEARVQELETSRVAAVDSAEAERRRIERDLHDGAQQRLVSLAMDLGTARERMEADPVAARQLVTEAHEEAKAALEELRSLVRGIHPVILEDRGLDAALSAVVARSPIPVELQVEVRHRPSSPVESTAYFVVAEALTNVARHAQATRAWVAIVRVGDKLIVEVRDDGRGGADETLGTGLRGLRDRVASVGGTMQVISPEGGPTTLLVEMPCG
jgi:signal transduction histidine kinase